MCRRKCFFALLIIVALICSGCSRNDVYQHGTDENVILKIAVFNGYSDYSKMVSKFENENPNVTVEVEYYQSEELSRSDLLERLHREIISGNGPDVIDYGRAYSANYVVGEYTEDLTKYFENDGSLFYKSVLDAFEYKGGLYAIPASFSMQFLVAKQENVETVEAWDMDEFIDLFEKSGTQSVFYNCNKTKAFSTLLGQLINEYVDCEKGECYFNSDSFKKILKFADSFPKEVICSTDEDYNRLLMDDKCFVETAVLINEFSITEGRVLRGCDNLKYIGYPSKSSNGVKVDSGEHVFAINALSKNKDLAWAYLGQYLSYDYQKNIKGDIPIRIEAFENRLEEAKKTEYSISSDGSSVPIVKDVAVSAWGADADIYCITEEDAETIRTLIGKATSESAVDLALYMIVLEEVQPFFEGQKDMDEIAELIQNRATIYVKEKQ